MRSELKYGNNSNNKYGAIKSFSTLCDREFASRAEMRRGEELRMLELAGEIQNLEYQPRWILSHKPKLTYTADFRYHENGALVVEDVKGILTEATRVRIAWLKDKYNVEVTLVKAGKER